MWDFSEASDVQLLGNLLSRWNTNMKGVTRALQTASESVIRVVASLMAIKLTYVKVAGVDKLKIELMYVLADGTGEVHWPKDGTRRMIEVSAAKEADIRAQISLDIKQMSTDLAKFPFQRDLGADGRGAHPQQPAAAARASGGGMAIRSGIPSQEGRQARGRFVRDRADHRHEAREVPGPMGRVRAEPHPHPTPTRDHQHPPHARA